MPPGVSSAPASTGSCRACRSGFQRAAACNGQRAGAALPAVWVDVPDPDPTDAETDVSAVLRQAVAAGAAVFKRLEGCGYGFGRVFFTAASGGDAGRGQVWQYRPRGEHRGELTLVLSPREGSSIERPYPCRPASDPIGQNLQQRRG
jgi:hypothetical protein